ncbi:MAG: 50S ribosomal protein L10 [Clostridia bacterium]|nr:50S ribosomal protein L10 [Clostridia bacterium]
MANETIVAKKQAYVEELSAKMSAAVAGVVVSYSGITVADDTVMRRKLRQAGVHYAVVKNTLLHRAADKVGMSELDDVLNGSTAIALSDSDQVAAARILCEYADKKDSPLTIKAGFVDGKFLSGDEVKELAKIPAKEVLVARFLGCITNPLASLARALDAIAEKQSA